ncbi:MAG: hypothetical protein DRP71_05540 [Verrucomicrobia bacterium]|nr:MAG: hypothetical protein DRP71_05540 [Verrucomicrobiota bacterium]
MRIRKLIFILAAATTLFLCSGCNSGNTSMSVGFSSMGSNGGYYGGSYGTHGSSFSIGKTWR